MALVRKRPTAQAWHAPSTPVPASPALQVWHVALPALDFSPLPHPAHIVDSGSAAFVFFGHSSHSSWPSRLLALPGMHGRHDAEPLPGWWKPLGHAEHVSAFWFSENRPAAHTTHVLFALLRRLPALHSEQDALPLPAVRPVAQLSQFSASGSAAKVSSKHSSHCACPSALLALPGMHGRHDAELLSGW